MGFMKASLSLAAHLGLCWIIRILTRITICHQSLLLRAISTEPEG
ncbi:MAG: hypothetical protein AAF501_13830 [Pseudomonadota bacterium]